MFSIDIDNYIDMLIKILKHSFGKRLVYIGLQGSYLRGEETPYSDIDIMAVIDGLCPEDLEEYRKALISAGSFDKSCGFICGREDLANWNPLEICHLLHSTKDYYGNLKELVPMFSLDDEKNYIKLSMNNLYHELCHRRIHADREKNAAKLPLTCKQVFYILQHLYYLKSGYFAATKQELLELLQGEDKAVLSLGISLSKDNDCDFDKAFSMLFNWCQSRMRNLEI